MKNILMKCPHCGEAHEKHEKCDSEACKARRRGEDNDDMCEIDPLSVGR